MYAIIVGAGEVGRYLGRELIGMGNEVLLIERDHRICEELGDELGSVSLCGDGCEVALLARAGIARADIFIAVTDQDDDNLAACQIAKQKFGVPQVIAKVNNPKNEHIFAKLGIDETVDRVSLVLEHIKLLIPMFPLIRLLNLKERRLDVVLVRVAEDSSAIGKPLRDLSLPSGSVACLTIRQGQECWVPEPGTTLEAGDQLVCLISSGSEEEVVQAIGGVSTHQRSE